jgi:hypothetical protein
MTILENDLRTAFRTLLNHCPSINSFLGDSLRSRMGSSDDWLMNRIVQAVFSTKVMYLGNPAQIEGLLAAAKAEIVRSIANDLNFREKDFDQRTWDSLAEIGASIWLAKNGFPHVEKLPRNGSPTPDFRVQSERHTSFVEVKHLRAPSPEAGLIWQHLGSRAVRNPGLYLRDFEINIRSGVAFEDEYCGDIDRVEIEKLVQELDSSLERQSSGSVCRKYRKDVKGKDTLEKQVTVDFKSSGRFSRICMSTSNECDSSSMRLLQSMNGLKEKTEKDVEQAYQQLCSVKDECDGFRIVILCWQKPDIYIASRLDNLETKYRAFVRDLECEKLKVCPNFRIVLLDVGELMAVSRTQNE